MIQFHEHNFQVGCFSQPPTKEEGGPPNSKTVRSPPKKRVPNGSRFPSVFQRKGQGMEGGINVSFTFEAGGRWEW